MRRYPENISSLTEEFQLGFRDFAAIEKEITLFSSPVSVDPNDAPGNLQLELPECHNRYRQLCPSHFTASWTKTGSKRLEYLLRKCLCGSTYLCEKTFSVMNINKNCVRTRPSDSYLRGIWCIKTTALEPGPTCSFTAVETPKSPISLF